MTVRALPAPASHKADDLPNSIEVEQLLLGGVLLNSSTLDALTTQLTPDDFYEPIHRRIFDEIRKLIGQGIDVNVATVASSMPDAPRIGEMTILQYLVSLVSSSMGVRGSVAAGETLVELAARRQMIAQSRALIYEVSSLEPHETASAKARLASDVLLKAADRIDGRAQSMTMVDATNEALNLTNLRYMRSGPVGLDPGIPEIMELTGRWHEKQLIVIPGGPKQGKSALAGQIAEKLAEQAPGYIYSGEMPKEDWARRALARRTGISTQRQTEGDVSEHEYESLMVAETRMRGLMSEITIDDRMLSLPGVVGRMAELKRTRGIKWAVIDHAGKFNWTGRKADDKEHEQTQEAASKLKDAAQQLGITIVLLCHLKRTAFNDYQGRDAVERMKAVLSRWPRYTDVPGSIDKHADHMIIPFQPRPVLAAMEPGEGTPAQLVWEDLMQSTIDKAHLILAISRHSEFPKRREMRFDGRRMNYYSRIKQYEAAITDGRLL